MGEVTSGSGNQWSSMPQFPDSKKTETDSPKIKDETETTEIDRGEAVASSPTGDSEPTTKKKDQPVPVSVSDVLGETKSEESPGFSEKLMKMVGDKNVHTQMTERRTRLQAAGGDKSSAAEIGKAREAAATKKAALAEVNKDDSKLIKKYKFAARFNEHLHIKKKVKEYVTELCEHGLEPDQVAEVKEKLYEHAENELKRYFNAALEEQNLTLDKKQTKAVLKTDKGFEAAKRILKPRTVIKSPRGPVQHPDFKASGFDKAIPEGAKEAASNRDINDLTTKFEQIDTTLLADFLAIDNPNEGDATDLLRTLDTLDVSLSEALKKNPDSPEILKINNNINEAKAKIAQKLEPGIKERMKKASENMEEYQNASNDDEKKAAGKKLYLSGGTLLGALTRLSDKGLKFSPEVSNFKTTLNDFGSKHPDVNLTTQ